MLEKWCKFIAQGIFSYLNNIYVEKQKKYIEKLLAPNYMQRLYSAFTERLSKHHIRLSQWSRLFV